jgi:transcription antitermination factor NusG
VIHVSPPKSEIVEPYDDPLAPHPAPRCDWLQLNWYALVASIRCEDRAAEKLRQLDLEVFAPTARRWIRPRGSPNWRQTARPLFPRYLFVGFQGHPSWWPVVTTNGVESVVCLGRAPIRIPSAQIVSIYQEHEAGAYVEDHRPRRRPPLTLKKGDMVAVSMPGMENTTAVVRRTPKKYAERVLLELLGRAVEVPVDRLREYAQGGGTATVG